MNLEVLLNRLGVDIEPKLLEQALTHRSYAYENGRLPNNERLEFLGDAVLGFVVTAHIHATLKRLPEGELTKVKNAVVSARALATAANQLGLGEYLRLGRGEVQTGGHAKTNLLADAFEAILGAAYVSSGLEAAQAIIEKFVYPMLENPDELRKNSDPKTTLQERSQALGTGAPSYETSHTGPDHERTFFAKVFIDDQVLGEGEGRSKKLAETNAAIIALAKLAETNPEPAKASASKQKQSKPVAKKVL
jgi:ribonuclease-3